MRSSILRSALGLAGVLALTASAAIAHPAVDRSDGARSLHLDAYDRAEAGHDEDASDVGPHPVATGFEHVSTFTFDFDGDGVTDTGHGSITDVWDHDGIAYLGTFYEPDCSRFGVRIVDVNDPANPQYLGNLPSMPNTRVNDVKAAELSTSHFEGDLLVATQEPCFQTNAVGFDKPSKGGLALYDVTDPSDPELLKRVYIQSNDHARNFGIHNTFIWQDDGRAYLGVVDDDNEADFRILDITKPTNPTQVYQAGWADWLGSDADPQGEGIGTFASHGLHDVWVEEHGGRTIAYLSDWDAGLVLLDVTDPTSPEFLGDSDYDLSGPEGEATGEEGNGHVAVPAPDQDGRYVLLGDEDFSPYRAVATYSWDSEEVEVDAAEGAFTRQLASYETSPLPTDVISAGGELCTGNSVAFEGRIALIKRGTCAFQTKADNAEAQGASGILVYNDEARGDALVTMAGTDSDIFGFFVGNSVGQAIEDLLSQGETVSFDVRTLFDGWGYLRVIDTRDGTDDGKFTEVASFATPNTFADPPLPGDYTMHNVVMGPAGTDWADTAFVSWYSDGMLAIDVDDPTNPAWVGQWIGCSVEHDCSGDEDTNGNIQSAATNFWGVDTAVIGGKVYVLGSDRNNGLVLLRPVAGASVPGALSPGNGSTP